LGGSKGSTWIQVRNVFIIFIVSGFWHGASFTFIIWGFLNALFILPSVLFKTNRNNLEIVAKGRIFPTVGELGSMIFTFILTNLAWVFFRSNSVQHAFQFLVGMANETLFSAPVFAGKSLTVIGLVLAFFVLIEWIGREKQFALEGLGTRSPRLIRWSFYYALGFLIFYFSGAEQQFIYFQF
jgi:D-alanyl-lipoteichoic acid acyltransferase DltB (MBOAT superfamily)